jgi:hypothetical protein
MSAEDKVKIFEISRLLLENELKSIEKKFQIDLGLQEENTEKDNDYYPQFASSVRSEAKEMSLHYELFYCLEKSIRKLIVDKMDYDKGKNWWDTKVPREIQENVKKNMDRELDSAVTPRSNDKIDYTTFGELGDIVKANWNTFSDTFNSQRGFSKVMNSLNVLRGPIAHCCPLDVDEVTRLKLAVKDWFRLME